MITSATSMAISAWRPHERTASGSSVARLDAAGIDQIEGPAIPVAQAVDPVPRDAGGVLYNRGPAAGQLIEQHGFAHIRAADDRAQQVLPGTVASFFSSYCTDADKPRRIFPKNDTNYTYYAKKPAKNQAKKKEKGKTPSSSLITSFSAPQSLPLGIILLLQQ